MKRELTVNPCLNSLQAIHHSSIESQGDGREETTRYHQQVQSCQIALAIEGQRALHQSLESLIDVGDMSRFVHILNGLKLPMLLLQVSVGHDVEISREIFQFLEGLIALFNDLEGYGPGTVPRQKRHRSLTVE